MNARCAPPLPPIVFVTVWQPGLFCADAGCDRAALKATGHCRAHDRLIVVRSPHHEMSDDCWLLMNRSPGPRGYPKLRGTHAHRTVYEALIGPVDPRLHLDHLCRRTSCINPQHMEPVTPWENSRRGFVARHGPLRLGGIVRRRSEPEFRRPWVARLRLCGRERHVGNFDTEDEARAALAAAQDHERRTRRCC